MNQYKIYFLLDLSLFTTQKKKEFEALFNSSLKPIASTFTSQSRYSSTFVL